MTEAPHLPIQPLLHYCRDWTRYEISAALGVHHRTVQGWQLGYQPTIQHRTADKHAIALGVHPMVIWGWAWIDAYRDPQPLLDHVDPQGDLPRPEIARRLGVHPSRVSHMRRGNKWIVDIVAQRICKHMNVTTEEIWT